MPSTAVLGLCFGLALPAALHGQQLADSARVDSLLPFRTGRWLVGLQGVINSTNSNFSLSPLDSVNFTSNHALELRGGYLFRDRLPVGLFLGTSRQSSREQFRREVEELLTGFWTRYYLTGTRATLYPEFSLFFANYLERNELDRPNGEDVDRLVTGKGFGCSLGLGFAYVAADILVFNVALDTNYLFLFGRREDRVLGTREPLDFSSFQFRFAVGVEILIRK